MDITMDNNKPSEIDNVTINQALMSNANTDMIHEMDETNNIFGVTGDDLQHVNDKLNNIIDLNNMNNPMNVIENKEHAILSAVLEKTCLENDGDMGPETSVDTTDDADNDTDPLECSTLSHSKETIPSSDYPFDNKFTPHSLELDLQDKAPSLTSPNTDLPFDTHGYDLHDNQNINFEDMSHNGMGNEQDPFTGKHDDLNVGEDNFKTDLGTHEIRETKTVCFEYNTDGMTDIEQLKNANEEMMEQMKSLDMGWGAAAREQFKGDLVYNQFQDFIEQPAEKKLKDELQQEHLEGLKDELVDDIQPTFDEINKGLSTVLDTPSSISPGSENLNFDSFAPHQKPNDQAERPDDFFDEKAKESQEISLSSHDNDLDDISEKEKHLNESPEYEKHSDLLEHDEHQEEFDKHPSKQQDQHFEDFADHESFNKELQTIKKNINDISDRHFEEQQLSEGFEEHESLKEELQMKEKHFDDFSQKFDNAPFDHFDTLNHQEKPLDDINIEEKHTAELNEPEKLVTEFDEQEKYSSESNELAKLTSEINESSTQPFEKHIDEPLHQDEQQEKYLSEANDYEKHNDEVAESDKDDEFNSMIIKDDVISPTTENQHDFESTVVENQDHELEKRLENTQNLAESIPKYDDDSRVEEKTEVVETVEKVDAAQLQQEQVEDFHTNLHQEFEGNQSEFTENQTNEMAIGPETQHLDESYDEMLQMNKPVSEQPLSSTTIDDTIPVVEPHIEEGTKFDMVSPLENGQALNEPSDELKDEQKVDKEDINETISKESELTIDQKSCDESLDEWNNTKGKLTEEDISGELETIEAEETVQKIESQQSEELNRNEAEEGDKTSDSSVVIEAETKEKTDIDISDNLDQEVDNMSSPLNPEAKEFVPSTSPISFEKRTSDQFPVDNFVHNISDSPFAIDSDNIAVDKDFEFDSAASPLMEDLSIATGVPPHMIGCMNGDDLVAQSPQKGSAMLDFQLPSPKEFETEVACRPSELTTPENLNLKESLHEPEKELISPMENNDNSINEISGITSPIDETLGKVEDIMNSVQMLPLDDELEEENQSSTSVQPDVTLNGEAPMIAELSNLKLEEPQTVTETPIAKIKVEKTAKSPEVKKTDIKSKTSTTGPKKAISSTSATISDSTKTKTSTTASKTKVSAGLTARPRTAPAPSSKSASTEKKSSTNVISARAKPEVKAPTTNLKRLPLTKPKPEDSKVSGTVRQVPSKVASTTRNVTTTARTSSTTSTTTATTKRTTLNTTSSTAAKSPVGLRATLSPITKTSTLASTHKPAISPRSTVTSTLRKTEAVKSPTSSKPAAAKTLTASATSTAAKTTSRASGGTTTVTKTTTTITKKLTSTTASKPATTTSNKKPMAIKKPIGNTTTTTAAKLKGAPSPIRAPVTSDTSEIKMNGTTPPAVVTANGNGLSEE